MKNTFLIFCLLLCFAANAQETFSVQLTPRTVTNTALNVYRIVGEINDVNGVLNASSAAIGDSLHMVQEGVIYPLVLTSINSAMGTLLNANYTSVAPFVSASPSITVEGVCNLSRKNSNGYISVAAGLPSPLSYLLENRFKRFLTTSASTTSSIKTVTVPITAYTDMQSVALSSVYSLFGGTPSDGIYKLSVVSPTSVNRRILLTGLGPNAVDNVVTSQTVGNGNELEVTFQGGSPILHEYFPNGWGGIRDSIYKKADASSLGLSSSFSFDNNAAGITFDFQSKYSGNLVATALPTILTGLPYIPVTISNFIDRGRYTVIVNGTSVCLLNFPSNVKFLDGTTVGNYDVTAGAVALNFIAVGTDLYMSIQN